MSEWINLGLDIILIVLVTAGTVQASRLIRHLAGLRESRAEMERFVREFNSTVARAEAGIKGLRQAARDGGDDLEQMVEKASQLRDELSYLVESADQIASRLASGVSAMKPAAGSEKTVPLSSEASAASGIKTAAEPASSANPSRAEQDLMKALEKLG